MGGGAVAAGRNPFFSRLLSIAVAAANVQQSLKKPWS
jgi:hypothetical protein